ncbi:MAG: flavodoxin [Alteromonadaceae bacterium]|nr:flavodoxin [Alteromonadaceae bacterium]
MNQQEIDALSQTQVSNLARVLYCLGLRPHIDAMTGYTCALNYKHLTTLLTDKHQVVELGRDINLLLEELFEAGLISSKDSVDFSDSLSGKRFVLPLAIVQTDVERDIHSQTFALHQDWVPRTETFSEICQLVGLIKKDFDKNELGEFIAYWRGRPHNQFSEYQWHQKFVSHLKNNRKVLGYNATQSIGYQQIDKQPEVVLSDSAKELIEKYHGKPTGKD